MKTRHLLVLLATALAVLAAACNSGSSTPTTEPTPTPVPVDLVSEDPNSDPDAFLAALPSAEVACAESAAGGRDRLRQMVAYLSTSAGMAEGADEATYVAVAACFSDATARGIMIGEVDRIAGGLSDATVDCMARLLSADSLTAVYSSGQAGDSEALLNIFRAIFCLDSAERVAVETNAPDGFLAAGESTRIGFIDAMECTADRRDADGNSVFEQVMVMFASGGDEEFDPFSGEGTEQLEALFALIPFAVECGLMTDEDFEGSGFTAAQMACLTEEGGDIFLSFFAISDDPNATPDLGQLAELFSALEACGIDPNQLMLDSDGGDGSTEPDPTVEIPSLDELGLPLTETQLACLQSYVSEEDLAAMIQTGQPPANLFEALDACDIPLEDFLQ